MLSLAVLLAHWALLQNLPLNLASLAADPIPLSFAMRTLAPEPVNMVKPVPVAVPKPVARPAPKPAPDPAPAARVDTQENAPPEDAIEPTPPLAEQTPQELASAPAQPEPEVIAAPRPPRETSAAFSFDGLPGSVKLLYKVQANKFPFTLTGELMWQQADRHYQASLSFGAFGLTRTQSSRGEIGADGLAPERFSDKLRSEVAAHFNREQAKVTFSANTPDAALLAGAQDRLSVLVQLAALVAGAPERFTPGTTLTIQTVGPRDADLWLFTVGNMELLELPGDKLQGLKLTRNPRQPYDQQVEIWLAPALSYMPARIRTLETNGDYVDLKWQASEPLAKP